MLQACLNGARGALELPGVPLTPQALACDGAAVRAAGAEALHIHPRDADGAETLAPADVAAALVAVRASVPGMPVGIGTGAWIAPGGTARHAHIAAWDVLPDYVSINLSETDAPEIMSMMHRRGIGIEAGIWSPADARRLAALRPKPALLRVLIEMPDSPVPLALSEAALCLEILKSEGVDAPILLHGEGQSAWPCLIEAARRGLDTRIGFEDVTTMPDGSPARGNAELIAAARALIDTTRRGTTG